MVSEFAGGRPTDRYAGIPANLPERRSVPGATRRNQRIVGAWRLACGPPNHLQAIARRGFLGAYSPYTQGLHVKPAVALPRIQLADQFYVHASSFHREVMLQKLPL